MWSCLECRVLHNLHVGFVCIAFFIVLVVPTFSAAPFHIGFSMSLSKGAGVPLSAEERSVLHELMQRAGISVSVLEDFPGDCDRGSDGGWSMMTPTPAAMTDASKRRLEESPERPSGRPYAPRAMCAAPSALEGDDVPGMNVFGKAKKGLVVRLPEGVPSLGQWGRSILDFGKYASRGWTYEEICTKSDKEIVSYVKWCRGQVDSAEGFLKDFGLFIYASEFDPEQRPLIPGTDVVRRFR